MVISYDKLWKLLIDKKMSKSELRRAADLAPNTMTKLNKEKEVSLSVLFKICMVLNAEIGEIVEFVQEPPCAVESIVTNESVDNE